MRGLAENVTLHICRLPVFGAQYPLQAHLQFPMIWWTFLSVSQSVVSSSLWPHVLVAHPPGSSVHGIFQARILEWAAIAAAAKSLQSAAHQAPPSLGFSRQEHWSTVGLRARTLEWVAISFSNTWKWKVKVKSLNRVWLFSIPWTAAYQAPPSMGFSSNYLWLPPITKQTELPVFCYTIWGGL